MLCIFVLISIDKEIWAFYMVSFSLNDQLIRPSILQRLGINGEDSVFLCPLWGKKNPHSLTFEMIILIILLQTECVGAAWRNIKAPPSVPQGHETKQNGLKSCQEKKKKKKHLQGVENNCGDKICLGRVSPYVIGPAGAL